MRWKLTLIVVGISLLGALGYSLFQIHYQRNQLIKATESSAAALSNTIEANLQHAMLTVDWEMLNDIVQATASGTAVDTLRIFDGQGRIGASSVMDEVGTRLDQEQRPCRSCHVGETVSTKKSVVYTADNGRQLLVSVNIIENQPQCYACHAPGNQILGVMMLETPLTAVNEQFNMGVQSTMLVTVIGLTVMISLVVLALNRHIVQPVEELSKGAAQIGAGNLDYQVPVINQDELGELAESFNAMRKQLKTSRGEMERREQELATLNAIGRDATQLLDLDDILNFALDIVVDQLGMAVCMIYLKEADAGNYRLCASRGLSQNQQEEIERRRQSGMDITAEVVNKGELVFVPNMAEESRFYGVWDRLEGRSYVKLPLRSRGTIVGVMGLVTPPGKGLTEREVEFLKAVGREIGIAIDNSLLLADTRRREKHAMTLYQLGTDISSSLALRKVLDGVAEAARELTDADIGLVGLYNEERQEVLIKSAAGVKSKELKGVCMPLGVNPPVGSISEEQPTMGEFRSSVDLNTLGEYQVGEEQGVAWLAVPLKRGERYLGLIEVLRQKPQPFRKWEAQLLMRLATQVVVSIENAQLYRQLHHLAALEERDRLAREMHDHLAQGLGYLNVKSSMTDDLMSDGQIDQARESLIELKKAVKILYTDVREDIFNLRTSASERLNFFSTLRDYLADYRTHYGLAVHLAIEQEGLVDFSPEVTSQLLRIIQEALTNVRRHSDAAGVLIEIMEEDGWMCIHIEDDGRGFRPSQVAQTAGQHYGLQIMRERAESVGGGLEINSQPGHGTQIEVRVPINLID